MVYALSEETPRKQEVLNGRNYRELTLKTKVLAHPDEFRGPTMTRPLFLRYFLHGWVELCKKKRITMTGEFNPTEKTTDYKRCWYLQHNSKNNKR